MSMEKRELICIGCPVGCLMSVDLEGHEVLSVSGNTCPKGKDYAQKECTHPTRIVTSTVKVEGGDVPVISVKTASDIPKERIHECMRAIKQIVVQAPVSMGQVVLSDAVGSGVDVVATKEAALAEA